MNFDQIVSDLKAERAKLDQAIQALGGSSPRGGRPAKSALRKRTMSPAARKRISAAMKIRWERRKGKSRAKKAAPPAKIPARKPTSPAARKKLAALMKERWAARKKAGAKFL